jgi:thiamine biosynthesis lipoprotein
MRGLLLTVRGKSLPWPFSTWVTPEKAEGFRGCRAAHPAADDFIHSLLTGVVFLVVTTWPGAARAAELGRFSRTELHMASSFTLVAYAADEPVADAAFTAAFARIAVLDARLNDYNPDSELSRLSGRSPTTAQVPVSDDLWAVLDRAGQIARLTDGAFDVTVGPLTRLWRQARTRRRLAAPEATAAALAAVGHRHVTLDEATRGVALARPGMRLDLGGIAQGFAADEALRVLAAHGLERALVNASGDIACGLPPPGATGWRVGIAPPRGEGRPDVFLHLARRAISTSGDAHQSIEIDGVRYSHIVNPRTGVGLTRRSSATVVAADCTTADALATALCVLGPERGLDLIAGLDGVETRIVTVDGDAARIHATAGFTALTAPPAP